MLAAVRNLGTAFVVVYAVLMLERIGLLCRIPVQQRVHSATLHYRNSTFSAMLIIELLNLCRLCHVHTGLA